MSNGWLGINFSGYSNPFYDDACLAAGDNLEQQVSMATLYADVQHIFAEDLPVVPLYWQVKIGAARPDLCAFDLDPTAASSLWNVEEFEFSTSCPGD